MAWRLACNIIGVRCQMHNDQGFLEMCLFVINHHESMTHNITSMSMNITFMLSALVFLVQTSPCGEV